MKIFLDDSKCRENFFPLTLTRHVALLRVGIYTIKEKWEKLTGAEILLHNDEPTANTITVQANVLPTLSNFETLMQAARDKVVVMDNEQVQILHHAWDLFFVNAKAIADDFELARNTDDSRNINNGTSEVYIHPSAKIENVIINADEGPVYIGEHALVMDGSMLRGPVAICNNAVVKMGTKLYAGTTIGPYCTAGGEIKNSILSAFSNKAHDGYLGDSYIGEWCNFGAGTSNSNVKNTAGAVAFNTDGKGLVSSGRNKGGLLMGDYSRCAINTSFNTGAVVGVCCNIFGVVNTKKYFQNFSWGSERYKLAEAINHISAWKKFKGQEMNEQEIIALETIYNSTT